VVHRLQVGRAAAICTNEVGWQANGHAVSIIQSDYQYLERSLQHRLVGLA